MTLRLMLRREGDDEGRYYCMSVQYCALITAWYHALTVLQNGGAGLRKQYISQVSISSQLQGRRLVLSKGPEVLCIKGLAQY